MTTGRIRFWIYVSLIGDAPRGVGVPNGEGDEDGELELGDENLWTVALPKPKPVEGGIGAGWANGCASRILRAAAVNVCKAASKVGRGIKDMTTGFSPGCFITREVNIGSRDAGGKEARRTPRSTESCASLCALEVSPLGLGCSTRMRLLSAFFGRSGLGERPIIPTSSSPGSASYRRLVLVEGLLCITTEDGGGRELEGWWNGEG